jgi:hypothetical protein
VSSKVAEALERTRKLPPQTQVEIRRGLTVRRTKGGIPVIRHHYSANPARDPDINPEWKLTARRKYTSQAAWDREQETVDNAGGGALVLADTLITHWKKIVIEDPRWHPDPDWKVEAGFDHGRANPTSLERAYCDFGETIYLCGEYYQPGREIWEHAITLKQMADLRRISDCYADPSIFPLNAQANVPTRKDERAKSLNEIYVENGIEIFSPFHGDHSDISFGERVLMHWRDLENREPTLKIVCRNFSESPQPGLHDWDCPNLLWEMMRMRRVKLTAQQLLSRNTSEAIVQKDNHALDAAKYLVMSHPEPSKKSYDKRVAERVEKVFKENDMTTAMLQLSKIQQEEREKEPGQQVYYGGNIRQRLAEEARKGNAGRGGDR